MSKWCLSIFVLYLKNYAQVKYDIHIFLNREEMSELVGNLAPPTPQKIASHSKKKERIPAFWSVTLSIAGR